MPKEKEDEKEDRDEQLMQFAQWHQESSDLRSAYEGRWAKNTRLVKGLFDDNEYTESKVRKRTKIFFRKIWAERWRVIAAFFDAYLRDRESFKLEGVDTVLDPFKAEILQKLVEYRLRQMKRKDNLFIQFIHAFQDIWDYCWATGKMYWDDNDDRPVFKLYPPEQVDVDMTVALPAHMRYVIFRNYVTGEELLEMGYTDEEELETLTPSSVNDSRVRSTRFANQTDPTKNVDKTNVYPAPEDKTADERDALYDRYEVWEIFWRTSEGIKFAVTNKDEYYLKKPMASPFGDEFLPVVVGMGLTEAHKLIGEGFPEPLEGPQESINNILNMRKDELALGMSPMNIVNRYANVDMMSLVNVRPGGIVLADDAEGAVMRLEAAGVTAGAYTEVASDEAMMDELSGVSPIKQGLGQETKATVAQINQSESTAKLDLIVGIVGETFVKSFYHLLIHLVQQLDTDEDLLRVFNEELKLKTGVQFEDIKDIDDFDADIELVVGVDKVSKNNRVQQRFLAMDKMIMANQNLVGLMGVPGAVPPQGLKFFDITAVMEEVLPDLGLKNYDKFFFNSGVPLIEGQGQSGGVPGSLTPQVGGLPPNNQGFTA